MWQQEFKLVFTAYGAQFEDWGVCATFYRTHQAILTVSEKLADKKKRRHRQTH